MNAISYREQNTRYLYTTLLATLSLRIHCDPHNYTLKINRVIVHAMLLTAQYSATSIIQTPLATALMLAYWISEIVWITEVLSFLTRYMVPSH